MKLGFFDSGMGGVFMMQECIKALPYNNYVYLGDTANLPYGPKSSEDILKYMTPCLLWLIEEQACDYLIVACNTASAQALGEFIKNYPQYQNKIINIVEITQEYLQNQVAFYEEILVLATQRTVTSKVYENIDNHSMKQLAMPGLVDLIELDDRGGALSMVKDALSYYPKVNYLLLGCTHYVYLEENLKEQYPDITILGQDSILTSYLKKHLQGNVSSEENGVHEYYVSGDPEVYSKQFNTLFHKIILKKN